MTVVKLVGARALCRWFVEADLYLGWFNINSLTVQDNGENYYQ